MQFGLHVVVSILHLPCNPRWKSHSTSLHNKHFVCIHFWGGGGGGGAVFFFLFYQHD